METAERTEPEEAELLTTTVPIWIWLVQARLSTCFFHVRINPLLHIMLLSSSRICQLVALEHHLLCTVAAHRNLRLSDTI